MAKENNLSYIIKVPLSKGQVLLDFYSGNIIYLKNDSLFINDSSEIKQDEEVYLDTKYLKSEDIFSLYKKAVSIIIKKETIKKLYSQEV